MLYGDHQYNHTYVLIGGCLPPALPFSILHPKIIIIILHRKYSTMAWVFGIVHYKFIALICCKVWKFHHFWHSLWAHQINHFQKQSAPPPTGGRRRQRDAFQEKKPNIQEQLHFPTRPNIGPRQALRRQQKGKDQVHHLWPQTLSCRRRKSTILKNEFHATWWTDSTRVDGCVGWVVQNVETKFCKHFNGKVSYDCNYPEGWYSLTSSEAAMEDAWVNRESEDEDNPEPLGMTQ